MSSGGLYSRAFIDAFKALVKDTDEFWRFLSMVDVDPVTFIRTMACVSPHAFTSNLVKFIQRNYIGAEPPPPQSEWRYGREENGLQNPTS